MIVVSRQNGRYQLNTANIDNLSDFLPRLGAERCAMARDGRVRKCSLFT